MTYNKLICPCIDERGVVYNISIDLFHECTEERVYLVRPQNRAKVKRKVGFK